MSELTLSQLLTKAIDNSNQLMSSHSIQSAPNQASSPTFLPIRDLLVSRSYSSSPRSAISSCSIIS